MPSSESALSRTSPEFEEFTTNVASNSTIASPLRNAEAFDRYCSQVQSKLAENAASRKEFLQAAHDRLTRLLQTALDIGDTDLSNELGLHRIAARELLDALSKTAGELPNTYDSTRIPVQSVIPQARTLRGSTASIAGDVDMQAGSATDKLQPNGKALHGSRSISAEEAASLTSTTSASRLSRRAVRPIQEIETDADDLREELKQWNARYPLLKSEGGMHRPNCLRLRAVACRQRKLEEEAGDVEVAEVNDLYDDVLDLLDAANDQEYSVALDDDVEPKPTAWQWGEMAERYEEMSRAQEAFDWWQKNRAHLTVADVQPLAEAVAAVQQRFNRLLFRVGARDPFQQQLFDDLRTWAREDQCYLYSLRPKVPMQELVERAGTLEEAWEHARQPIFEEERRQQVLANVVRLVGEPDFGSAIERDERRLRDMLVECKLLRLGAADRKLKDALLPWSFLLDGDERFKDFHRELSLEWERRLEVAKPDENVDADIDAAEAVPDAIEAPETTLEQTRGKRCVILGGEPHESLRARLERVLMLQELSWPIAGPSDELSRFDTEIRHADIVVLISRFSRREWVAVSETCDIERKIFVHVTTGSELLDIIGKISSHFGGAPALMTESAIVELANASV